MVRLPRLLLGLVLLGARSSFAAMHQKDSYVSPLNKCKYLLRMGQITLNDASEVAWPSTAKLPPVKVADWGISTTREQRFWENGNCGEVLRGAQMNKRPAAYHTKSKVYAALTTLPSRVGNLLTVVESLAAQTLPPTAVLLAVPKYSTREKTEYKIPAEVRDHPLVHIVDTEDRGPATKLLGPLEWLLKSGEVDQDKDMVIAVDDDLWYRPGALSAIVQALDENPRSVQTGYAFDVGTLSVGQGADMMGWRVGDLASLTHFRQPDECRLVDDVWFSSYAKSMRLKMMVVPSLMWPHVGYLKDKPGETKSFSDESSLRRLTGANKRETLNAACEIACRHAACVDTAPGVSAGISGLQMVARSSKIWRDMLEFFRASTPPLQMHVDDTCVEDELVQSKFTKAYADASKIGGDQWQQKYAAETFLPMSLRASPYLGDESSSLRFVNMPTMYTLTGMPVEGQQMVSQCASHIKELLEKPEYRECSHVNQDILYGHHENAHYKKGVCPLMTALTFDHGICSFSSKFGKSMWRMSPTTETFRSTTNLLHGSFPNCHDTQKDVTIPVSSIFLGADGYGPKGYTTADVKAMKSELDTPRKELLFHKGSGRKLDVSELSPQHPQGMRNLREEINELLGQKNRGAPRLSQEEFYGKMRNSNFCLAPYGDGLWSPRLTEALTMGCIPVIFPFCQDFSNCPELDSTLPYFDLLDYETFAVILPANKIPRMKQVLEAIPEWRRVEMRKNGQRAQPFFLHKVDGEYTQGTSTLDMFMFELWMRKTGRLGTFGRRSVIMGYAYGPEYDNEKLMKTFVETLHGTGYPGQTIIGVSNDQTSAILEYYKRHNMSPLRITPKKAVTEQVHLGTTRFMDYKRWLEDFEDEDLVLLTDMRDVLFQSDPFVHKDFLEGLRQGTELFVFAEGSELTIETNSLNRGWIASCWGNDILEKMRDNTVSCSGTIMGTKRGIMMYLDAFIDEVELRYEHGNVCRIDQGTHNYVLYQKLGMQRGNRPGAKVKLFEFGEGPIITVGVPCHQMDGGRWLRRDERHIGMRVTLDDEGFFLNRDGSRSPCVHQFDRCKKLFAGKGEGEQAHPFLGRDGGTPPFKINVVFVNKLDTKLDIVRIRSDGKPELLDATLGPAGGGSEEHRMDVYDGESFKFFEDYASGGSQVLHTWKADSSGKRTQEVEIDRKIYALFKNRGHNDVLEIFWVGRNEDGSENLVPQGEIPPLKWIGVGTHPGHTFAVKIKFGQKKGELLRWTADMQLGARQEVALEPEDHEDAYSDWRHHDEF